MNTTFPNFIVRMITYKNVLFPALSCHEVALRVLTGLATLTRTAASVLEAKMVSLAPTSKEIV